MGRAGEKTVRWVVCIAPLVGHMMGLQFLGSSAIRIRARRIKSNRFESRWNETNRLMFKLGFLLVEKLSKGFVMSSTKKKDKDKEKEKRKNTYRKYLQFNRPGSRLGLGLGLGFLRMSGGYVIWWAFASVFAVSAAVNNNNNSETWEDMNIHAYVKNLFENCPYAPLHRCHSCHTAATFMCPKQRHRHRHKSLAYADPQPPHSTPLMPTEFTLIIAKYGIRNTE